MRPRVIATALLTLCVVAATATVARAEMPYPADIDQALNVDVEKIEPPSGCQLCHTDPSGGTLNLRPFGQLMVSKYGLTVQDATLGPAVQALQMDSPKLVMDLQNGVDPNTDVSDPVPLYGCAIPAAGAGASMTVVWPALTSLLLLARRRVKAAGRT
jgi:hypothetical protein